MRWEGEDERARGEGDGERIFLLGQRYSNVIQKPMKKDYSFIQFRHTSKNGLYLTGGVLYLIVERTAESDNIVWVNHMSIKVPMFKSKEQKAWAQHYRPGTVLIHNSLQVRLFLDTLQLLVFQIQAWIHQLKEKVKKLIFPRS